MSTARADGGKDYGASAESLVFPPQSHAQGASYEEWAARFWQRVLSLPVDAVSENAPLSDGQSGDVWLIAGPLGGDPSATTQFSVPEGKALFIGVLSTSLDNADCPTFTDFSVKELREQLSSSWSAVTETTCTIDGVDIPGLSNPQNSPYLTDTSVFNYTLPDHDNYATVLFGATCIDGGTTIGPAVAEGVFLMLKPLSVGQHIVHTTAEIPMFLMTDITYEITVTRGH